MRISDWSSDVCSSDLVEGQLQSGKAQHADAPKPKAESAPAPVAILIGNWPVADINSALREARGGGPPLKAEVEGKIRRSRLFPSTSRSDAHTSELPSLTRIPYAVSCLI